MCHQHTDSRAKMPLLFFTLSYMNLEQVGDYHPVSAMPPAQPGLAAWEAGKGRPCRAFFPVTFPPESFPASLCPHRALSGRSLNTHTHAVCLIPRCMAGQPGPLMSPPIWPLCPLGRTACLSLFCSITPLASIQYFLLWSPLPIIIYQPQHHPSVFFEVQASGLKIFFSHCSLPLPPSLVTECTWLKSHPWRGGIFTRTVMASLWLSTQGSARSRHSTHIC